MLSFNNLELVLGGKTLFDDVSLTIHHHQKVGLVGANGTGKTSLFKIIKKEIEVDQSTVSFPSDLRISYLAQEVKGTDEIALDYVLSGDANLIDIQKKIEKAEIDENYEILGELYEVYSSLDGYSAKSKAEQLMVGLGFKSGDFNKPLKDFSGGWRVRLNLAKTLMQPSDLMLLDEPTNHLDLDAILWLSNWIKSFKGALILISHDRDFLDDCISYVAHLYQQSIELYSGNYSQFEILRAAKMAEIQSNFIKQQKEVAHMQSFINRFKAKATKARQAQSRVKALEKMELIAPAHIDSPFNFTISETDKISNPLVTLNRAGLGYSEPILSNVAFTICPGDRIGLLGPNGAGKSTLIKSIVGTLPILDGDRETGTNIKVGYFSQHQVDDLDLSISAFMHIQRLDETKTEKQIRTYLGGFAFKGDKVKDPIRLFSGGEKARLAFAIISYQKPNILLMDEPTNHLDMEMRHALTVAIQTFKGAILLISHDRHLLNSSVDTFYLIDNGTLEIFDGDLDDYKNYILDIKSSDNKESKKKKSIKDGPKEDNSEKIKTLNSSISKLDKRLFRLNTKLTEANNKLADPELYSDDSSEDLQDLIRNQLELTNEVEVAEKEWMDKAGELESFK
ncbi:ATP-binding cassette domain-containing protein [Gammaproteobacteria bacterium]|nr:ATP-binding cassette domain-containing protein [Gammaproteobacteria bacterium]MDA9001141.1 ATP-binding cassette domain-containing protein [Gammaproteobacteria bacterium]MDA9041152.1 ATP-binding cassette domain-containing protein [Gammaproteobacteria bacterium]MDA9147444.1 ATP-binding cassette domain-containing protein [Gammaproteobacteria bacterium]MDA9353153.1 ATP-binding cassette domain-containing protein [Gammaproteobacteria bacterium]